MSTTAPHNESARRRRAACERLRERMRTDPAWRVEDLLADDPGLAGDDDALLELILAEMAARRARGDDSTASEWAERIPSMIPDPQRREGIEILLSTEMKTLSESTAGAAPAAPPRGRIGRYHVLEEIGRGGMGVVYKARQISPGRIVAIKMILAGDHANARERSRLRTEAEAAAKLAHPNIVQILDADYHEGLPFLVMEFVDGGTLARMIRSAPQPIRWASRLIETLARAIHVAHRSGIVHRDLNPTNILMTQAGTPKIGDFGLAKFILAEGAGSQSGRLLGTPSYMAPEQLAPGSRQVDARTDVYALGAVLYEMLTGTPPFRGLTPMETLCQVAEGEVVPPSKLRHGLPEDLETICLKCLDRNPAARYADARALADDLRRFQDREPILARRTPRLRRAIQWAGREPLAAAFLALSLLLLILLLSVAGYYSFTLRNLTEEATTLTAQLRVKTNANLITKDVAGTESVLAKRNRYDFHLGRIHDHAARGELEVAIESFDELKHSSPPPAGFEWRYVDRLIHRTARLLSDKSAHQSAVGCIAASRDGRTLISGDRDGRVVEWDVDSGEPATMAEYRGRPVRGLAVASSPDGRPTAFATVHADEESSVVGVWDATGRRGPWEFTGPGGEVAEVGFARDGSLLAVRCRAAGSPSWRIIFFRAVGDEWLEAKGDEIPDARCVAFSPAGDSLAIGAGDGRVEVRGPDGRESTVIPLDPARPTALAFSNDGGSLATGWDDGRVVVQDVRSGSVAAVLEGEAGGPDYLAFGPGGESIVVLDKRSLSLRELRPGGSVVVLQPLGTVPTRLAVSPDGGQLVAGFEGRPVLAWDLARPFAEGRRLGELLAPSCLAFSPAGDALYMNFDQPGIFVRPTTPAASPRVNLAGHSKEAWSLAFSPDGTLLASGGDDHQIKLWDVATGAELAAVEAHSQTVTGLAFSPSGDHLASVSLDGSWKIWRPSRGADGRVAALELLHTLRPVDSSQLRCVAYSADGLRIAASGLTPDILLFRAPAYDEPTVIPGAHTAMITALAFGRGPRDYLATAACDRVFRVWDPEDRKPVVIAMRGDGPLMALAFSPTEEAEGALLAVGGDRRQIEVVDTRDFKIGDPIREHPASIRALSFSAQGDTLATGCDDGRVRLCDVATRQVVLALEGHRGRVNAIAFSNDDSTLASCSHSGQVILWKAGPPHSP